MTSRSEREERFTLLWRRVTQRRGVKRSMTSHTSHLGIGAIDSQIHVANSPYVSRWGTFRNTVLNFTQFYALNWQWTILIMDMILYIRIGICWNSSLYSTLQAAEGEGRRLWRHIWRGVQGSVTKSDEWGKGVNFSLKSRDVIYGRLHIGQFVKN